MKILYYMVVIATFMSCSEEKTKFHIAKIETELSSDFDSIQIRQGLNESMYFDFMGERRVLSSIDDMTSIKFTSNINIVKASDSLDQRVGLAELTRCIAHLEKDTLVIFIDNNTEVGYGVQLKIFGSKFQALPYFSTHLVYTDTIPVVILNQHLRLNKSKFAVGDSIFGDLHLRAKEGSINWYADGLFRGKIEKAEKL